MSSRVVRLTVVAAAVLSVVAVPLVANLVTDSWKLSGTASALIGASIAAATVTLAGAIINLLKHPESIASSDNKERTAFRLIRTFASMERAAEAIEVRDSVGKPYKMHLSLRDVWTLMSTLGVWDREEQIGFDLALRARNAIVHGDLDELDVLDLTYATEKAERLLEKMYSNIDSKKSAEI
ncbi:hypothetical protein [Micromonospora sp. SL4-19]|uniref:hypothetical protein n=1 Tax=Micromonospora sp. SL4-19 TaxID=3399129 RepID=UPI003A4DDA7E